MKYFFLAVLIGTTVQISAQVNPGINFSNMDTKTDPRNDFYGFSNGTWQKTFQLPESDARYGSFNEIRDNNLKRIKKILLEISTNKTAVPNSDLQRMRDFYNTAMDSALGNRLKIAPIKAQLARIDSINTIEDLFRVKSEFDFIGVDLFFNINVSPDLKNSKKNVLYIQQGGYGMGDRDYYHEPRYENVRAAYLEYLSNLFLISSTPIEQAKNNAEEILAYEMNITNKAFTRLQMRDIDTMYNIYSPKNLQELTPSFPWASYFKAKNIKQPDTVIVGMVNYMKQLDILVSKAPLAILKIYAKGQLLMAAAPYLSSKFQTTHFIFRGKVLTGATQMKPRWERVFNSMNATIGEMLSQVYVKKYFSPEDKIRVNKLIDNLVASYRTRIASRTWMSQETKNQAYKKLNLMIRKIAYPDKWKTYKGLTIGTESHWDNVCRANRYAVQFNLNELKKPVDRKKWQMTPVTVNAYYEPTTNEITFPAAILQPPFYDPKADDAANYGTMGAIIGHELTHGFDDQGSQFDAHGNLKMWWTEGDLQNFKTRKERIIEQFNNYVLLDSLHVNGKMTQGENIADLGGLTIAYYAYKRSLGAAKSKTISGYTGEQRFFIAWAQGWKSMVRDEEIKRLLTMDYHAPAYLRAFAPLTNMKEFYEAFGVKPGDKMYVTDDKRVEIW